MRACLQPRAATAQKTVSASVVAVMSSFRSPLLKFYMHSYTFMHIRTRMYTCICSRLTSCNITYIQTDIQKTHKSKHARTDAHTDTQARTHARHSGIHTVLVLALAHAQTETPTHTHTDRRARARTQHRSAAAQRPYACTEK